MRGAEGVPDEGLLPRPLSSCLPAWSRYDGVRTKQYWHFQSRTAQGWWQPIPAARVEGDHERAATINMNHAAFQLERAEAGPGPTAYSPWMRLAS